MKPSLLLLLSPLMILALSGCATITSTPMQEVYVMSDPVGANVSLNGVQRGKTPTTLLVSRWGKHRLTVTMQGFKPYEVELHKEVNKWVFGNILIGGLIGIVIDSATGAIFEIDSSVYAPLKRVGPAPCPVDERTFSHYRVEDQFLVMVVKKPNHNWKKIGTLERL